MNHLTEARLSLFVEGRLSAADEEDVGLHVGSCSECARRLQLEARFELLLHDAAQDSLVKIRRRPSVSFLAVAAALVLVGAGTLAIRWTERLSAVAEARFPAEANRSSVPLQPEDRLAENDAVPLGQPRLSAPQFEFPVVTHSGLEVW